MCDVVDAESYKAVFHSKFVKLNIVLCKWFINVK